MILEGTLKLNFEEVLSSSKKYLKRIKHLPYMYFVIP